MPSAELRSGAITDTTCCEGEGVVGGATDAVGADGRKGVAEAAGPTVAADGAIEVELLGVATFRESTAPVASVATWRPDGFAAPLPNLSAPAVAYRSAAPAEGVAEIFGVTGSVSEGFEMAGEAATGAGEAATGAGATNTFVLASTADAVGTVEDSIGAWRST